MDDIEEEFFDEADIEAGKTMALLCFIPICCVNFYGLFMAISKKDNDFHCFHARQSLGLTVLAVGYGVVTGIIGFVAGLISATLSMIVSGLFGLIGLVFLVLFVIGLLNTRKNEYVAMPLVGAHFTKFFKFIKKEEKV